MDRRLFIAGLTALSVGATKAALGQDLQTVDIQNLINSTAENISSIAQNRPLHNLYANLVNYQVQLRIDENFNGYESEGPFSQGANSVISETLFSDESRNRLLEIGLKNTEIGDRLENMGKIYETQKDFYNKFLQLITSSTSELGSIALPQEVFIRAMLYFAISLLALNRERFDQATESSWIWPFCSRR